MSPTKIGQLEDILDQAQERGSQGAYADVLPLAQQAETLAREQLGEDHPAFAMAVFLQATAHRTLGDLDAAERGFRQACESLRAAGDLHLQEYVVALSQLGSLLEERGQAGEAEQICREAIALAERRFGRRASFIVHPLSVLGSALRRQGRFDDAQQVLVQAQSILQGERGDQGEKSLGFGVVLEHLAQVALDRGDAEGARQLFQQAEPIVRAAVGDTHPTLTRVRASLASIPPPFDATAERDRRLGEIDVGAVAKALPPDAVLVRYLRLPRDARTYVYTAVVLPAGDPAAMKCIEVGSAAALDARIASFRTAVKGLTEAGDELRVAVFDPLRPHLAGRTRLLLDCEGDLMLLPFDALPDGSGRRLIDGWRITYETGTSSLFRKPRTETAPSPAVIVGDTDSRLETKLIAGMVERARLWPLDAALPQRLRTEAQSPLILHLATPSWTSEAVADLPLSHTELVVLTANEGVGPRQALAQTGARSLIVSLWRGRELATAVLMGRFYSNVLKRRIAKDEALRDAQRYTRDVTINDLRPQWLQKRLIEIVAAGNEPLAARLRSLAEAANDHKPFTAPHFWSGFVFLGDPAPLPAADQPEGSR